MYRPVSICIGISTERGTPSGTAAELGVGDVDSSVYNKEGRTRKMRSTNHNVCYQVIRLTDAINVNAGAPNGFDLLSLDPILIIRNFSGKATLLNAT